MSNTNTPRGKDGGEKKTPLSSVAGGLSDASVYQVPDASIESIASPFLFEPIPHPERAIRLEKGRSIREAKLTPVLTKDQHAAIFGYDSGRSAARALSAAWTAANPNKGVRRALDPAKLFSHIRKFREGRALLEKWPIPETEEDILDMYAHPEKWKGRGAAKVRMKP